MTVNVKKAAILGFIAITLTSFSTAQVSEQKSSNIEKVTAWPDNPDHGEEVYIDVKVDENTQTEEVWAEISSGNNHIKSTPLTDSNNDGYYVSPVAFTAEGGETYEITVKASKGEEGTVSETVQVSTNCEISFADTCLF